MEGDRHSPQPLERWFWWGAIATLLFMVVGCLGYLASVFFPIPADQRALVEARPTWMVAAYRLAVWSGLAGAAALLLRRRVAVPLLLVSLLGAIFTFLPYLVEPRVRELASGGDRTAGLVVVALCLAALWFSRHSQQRGWLR